MCYDKPLINRPAFLDSGDIAFVFPQAMQEKSDEIALGHQLICKRRLFGAVYREFLPKFFDNMPPDSGVMIGAFVPTDKVLPGVLFPGDIDLLIIPYASDRLLLSMTLAIELKVVRATYARQGRSPNQYGFSQANALLRCGFPYAGVAHLIVSDESPEDAWRDVYETTIVDETGRCSPLRTVRKDMMPSALINRSFGRLRSNCSSDELGYVSVYIANEGIWDPLGRQATHNPDASEETMSAVGDFYELNAHKFLDTRRY
ncbi:hypothetical protein [Vreelandella zhaodongensis]|uniref:Restriction endonuclease n=1 Tax=Vreelandella zhaodongensis TaxID=1176240 RepID=A0ABX2SU24_VREZH|nr:hypothetical protein [Halomonas zhaodongensis]NYS45590.1 hypothetical protein [Halomonas zhaodongensis]